MQRVLVTGGSGLVGKALQQVVGHADNWTFLTGVAILFFLVEKNETVSVLLSFSCPQSLLKVFTLVADSEENSA